jgi:hypothetical protein
MRKVLFLLTVFALAVAAPAYAASVGGTWALTMSGPQGEENFDIVIKDAGGSLEVSATHPMLQEMVGTGTLKGSDINFSIKATGQMAVELAFTGKVEGNKMEGTREIKMAAGGGGQGGAPGGGGQGGAPAGGGGGDMGNMSDAWSAVKK